jgi:hypothetical protein
MLDKLGWQEGKMEVGDFGSGGGNLIIKVVVRM